MDMAGRTLHRLSARKVTTERKKGRYADGGGLYLQVSDQGSKSWLLRFMQNGKARQMGLGAVHTVSLAEARDAALKCRRLLHEGADPIEERKRERVSQRLKDTSTRTFKECAEAYIKSHSAGWRNAKHAAQWSSTLNTYAYPTIGSLPVQDVTTGLVMNVLEPIWSTKTETASRLRGRIEAILDWATSREFRKGENPARWGGHLSNQLPAKSKVSKVKHHAALPYDDIGTFMIELSERDSVSARGLEFQILTAARTGEVMGATWPEVDLDKATWTLSSERMKADKEHRVPLSEPALAVLHGMKDVAVSPFVFPGAKRNRPLSNMAFLQLLKRMGKGDLTAHGFRSTFRDWAAEQTAYPRDVAELALAHSIGDKVEAAYRRGDLFEKRRNLMDAWAGYCSTAHDLGGKVIPIKGAGGIT
jgi:integrase